MKAINLITMLAVSGALVACESADTKAMKQITESGAAQLTTDEIRDTLIGNSIYQKGKKGNSFQYTGCYQDGTATGRIWGLIGTKQIRPPGKPLKTMNIVAHG